MSDPVRRVGHALIHNGPVRAMGVWAVNYTAYAAARNAVEPDPLPLGVVVEWGVQAGAILGLLIYGTRFLATQIAFVEAPQEIRATALRVIAGDHEGVRDRLGVDGGVLPVPSRGLHPRRKMALAGLCGVCPPLVLPVLVQWAANRLGWGGVVDPLGTNIPRNLAALKRHHASQDRRAGFFGRRLIPPLTALATHWFLPVLFYFTKWVMR